MKNGYEKTNRPGYGILIAAIAAAAMAMAILTGCGGVNDEGVPESFIREASRGIHREMRRDDIAGMAVAVVWDDDRSWTEGFGSAGAGREINAETPMMVASVTKLFTAVAVMTLVEDGFVDLDAPIGAYVPAMAGYRYPGSPEPTVRDLLTHHGGLPSDFLKGFFYNGPPAGYREAFMEHIPAVSAEPATEPPRLLAHYSNSGYLLLGALVAEVTGRPYADYVEEEILEPLGMMDSGFLDPRSSSTLSRGFVDGEEIDFAPVTGLPEGGIALSASDLALFMGMILAGGRTPGGERILQEATLDEMTRRQNGDVALDFDFSMGLGFHLMELPGYPGVTVAWHDGGTHPFASTLMVSQDHGVGVAMVSNTDENLPFSLAYRVLAKAVEVRTGERLPHSRIYSFGEMAGRPLNTAELPGMYASEIGAIVVGGSPGKPTLDLAGMTLHMVPKEANTYGLQARIGGFLPLPIADLARLRLAFREIDGRRAVAYYDGGKFQTMALAVEPEPIPDSWGTRFGLWSVVNPDPRPFAESLALGVDEELGFLTVTVKVASVPEPFVLPVLPRGEDVLLIAGLGRHLGETIRFVDEGGERLHWAGLTFEKAG